VLAVCAHPDDETFGLGALLAAFADRGAKVSVLCFTRGEASTLGPGEHELAELRAERGVEDLVNQGCAAPGPAPAS
jgi:LmbE family N-acetylglucosaminyl deacetylase